MNSVSNAESAKNIGYNNTDSGLTATDVQGAVDELNGNLIKLHEINLSGTVDANGDVGITGLTQRDYPVAFLSGDSNSSDAVIFFDGSSTSGYQKYCHFLTKRNVAVTGKVIYLNAKMW